MRILPLQAQNATPDLSAGLLDNILGLKDKAADAASSAGDKASSAANQAQGKVC